MAKRRNPCFFLVAFAALFELNWIRKWSFTTTPRGLLLRDDHRSVATVSHLNVTIQNVPEACLEQDKHTNTTRLQPCRTGESFPSTGFHVRRLESASRLSKNIHKMVHGTNGCVVSHRYKFVYIHVLKSGGMSMKSFLKRALCQNSTRMPCASGREMLHVASCKRVWTELQQRGDDDFFIWSIIRNPFARLFSGYAMAREAAMKEFDFVDFVQQPDSRRWLSRTDPVHYRPQYQFLFNEEVPIVDFLVRLETLSTDMPLLLDLLASPELSQYFSQNGLSVSTDTDYGNHRKKDELGGDLRRAYRQSNLVEAAVREYQRDFQLFHYDTKLVPS